MIIKAGGKAGNNTRGSGRKMAALLEIDLEKCTGCGVCVEKCPTQAVTLVNGKATIVRPDACNYCTECETYCDAGAITCPFEIILAVDAETGEEPSRK